MRDLSSPYQGQQIAESQPADQVGRCSARDLTDHYFSVRDNRTGLSHGFPLSWILHVVTGEAGVTMPAETLFGKGKSFPIAVEVYHHVIYKGSVGFGMSF